MATAPTNRPADEAGGGAETWLAWAALAALWGPLLWRLHHVWSSTPDQAFGWAVPVLAVYLALERWRDRPAAGGLAGMGAGFAWLAVVIGSLVMVCSLPLLEANLFWPRAQWGGTAGALLATAGGLALTGGWRWSAHFWFPTLFITTALSWPTALHNGVVTGLGGVNAWLAAEFSSACGRPALATGNIIEVGSGFVGVDEACSGLRSLQTVWMVGWFFGELYRLGWGQRLGLVLLALITAFLGNVVRTVFLTWQAAAHGPGAVEGWHDTAGGVILVITLVVVALLGWWFARGKAPATKIDQGRGVRHWRLPRVTVVVFLTAGVLGSAGTELWYRLHERGAASALLWRLAPNDESWHAVSVPEAALRLLGNPASEGFAWTGGRDRHGLAYVFRWNRDVVHAGAAELHDPTICLPAIGAVMEGQLASERLVVDGYVLEFQVYRFATVNGVQYVFFGLWDGSLEEMRLGQAQHPDDPTDFRLRLVMAGERRAELAHITFVTSGMPEELMARDWLRAWGPRLLAPLR